SAADGPRAVTRNALERSNAIVRGSGDRQQKLLALRDVLRDFLDTEALARLAAGKHLDGRSPEETAEFLRLFRELFIRTYVQRLLLFDAPDFAYGEERVTGDTATVSTEIVTPRDRFTVDYTFRHTQSGWRATDILVGQVSRAEAERLVRDANKAAAAITFPPELSKQYLQGRSTEIELLTDPAAGSDLEAIKVLLLLMDKDAAALADPFSEEKITLKEKNLTGNRLSVTAFEQNVPGFSLMFVLLAVIFGTAMSMHDERDWGTLPRLLVAPGGFTRLLLGKFGARFVVGVVQMLCLFLWGHWMFGVSLGSSPWAFIVLS